MSVREWMLGSRILMTVSKAILSSRRLSCVLDKRCRARLKSTIYLSDIQLQGKGNLFNTVSIIWLVSLKAAIWSTSHIIRLLPVLL